MGQKRKNKIANKKGSHQKLKVKIKRKSPKQLKSKLQIAVDQEVVNPYGFERRLQAESILGVMKSSDEGVMFLIKWKDSNEADLVSSKEANINCPELVIKYYEENLYLKDSEGVWKTLDST